MSSSLRTLTNLFRSTAAAPKPTSKLVSKRPKPVSKSAKTRKSPKPPKPPKPPKTPEEFKSLLKKLKAVSTPDKFHIDRVNDYVLRLAAANQFSLIEKVVQHYKQVGDVTDEAFAVSLIALYGRSGMLDNAYLLFDEMPQKTCKSFNALLAASVYAKKFDLTEELFRKLPDKFDIKPDTVSYNILINSYCESGSLDLALNVIEEMESNGVELDLVTFNTLLAGFYRHKRVDQAEKVWSLMETKNLVPNASSYDPKISFLIESDQILEAVEAMDEMKSNGIEPDRISYYLLIKGFREKGNLEETKRWYDELSLNGVRPDGLMMKTILPFVCDKDDLEYAFMLSKEAIKWKCVVNVKVMQDVVDKLVKESKIDEAKELIALASSLKYYNNRLKLLNGVVD